MTQKIYIKPVPRTSVLGVTTKQVDYIDGYDANGNKMQIAATKAPIKRFSTKVTNMGLPVSWETGKFRVFDTTTKADNPYYGDKNDLDIPSQWLNQETMLRKTPYITWQMYYELKHNVAPNTYTQERHSYDKTQHRGKSQWSYLETLSKGFYDGITVLDLDIPEDEIWYLAFKLSANNVMSKFAINIEDAQNKPNALFYIVDEDVEDAQVVSEYDLEDQAMAKYYEIKTKLGKDVRYQLAVLLDLTTTHAISDDKVLTLLRNYLTKGSRRETAAQRAESKIIYSKFLKYYDDYVDATRRAEFNARYLLKEGVNREVIRKKENEYLWLPNGEMNAPENLGREETVIKKLKDKKNADIVAELKEQIMAKGVTFE